MNHYNGFGIGLRSKHYQSILQAMPREIDWFEILSEDYMDGASAALYYLDKIREHYVMAMHGVSLSIGGTDALNWDYLAELKQLIKRVEPLWVSDHLCWTGVDGRNSHDLLPLPYTDEALQHVSARIRQVQDYLERPILIENVSSYVSYSDSAMTEWQFLSELTAASGCYLLLDVNNVYVNAFNHKFNPLDFLRGVPAERVYQFHLAGHLQQDTQIIDTHGSDIIEDVWALYAEAVRLFPEAATLIERDEDIPELAVLLAELAKAKSIWRAEHVEVVA